jgi:hypothetical protein
MILLTHPFGNANVRAVLQALWSAGLLEKFVTTLGWSKDSYPYLSDHIRGKLRRNYALPVDKIDIHPLRESIRLIAMALRWRGLTRHETGWASIDQVWASLDRKVAGSLHKRAYGANLSGVYAYEDCAWATFSTAQDLGLQRIYDLPIAYCRKKANVIRIGSQRLALLGIRQKSWPAKRKSWNWPSSSSVRANLFAILFRKRRSAANVASWRHLARLSSKPAALLAKGRSTIPSGSFLSVLCHSEKGWLICFWR